jgi:cysteine desulfurase
LSRYNTAEEINRVIEVVPPIIKELRALSPFGRDRPPTTCAVPHSTE